MELQFTDENQIIFDFFGNFILVIVVLIFYNFGRNNKTVEKPDYLLEKIKKRYKKIGKKIKIFVRYHKRPGFPPQARVSRLWWLRKIITKK